MRSKFILTLSRVSARYTSSYAGYSFACRFSAPVEVHKLNIYNFVCECRQIRYVLRWFNILCSFFFSYFSPCCCSSFPNQLTGSIAARYWAGYWKMLLVRSCVNNEREMFVDSADFCQLVCGEIWKIDSWDFTYQNRFTFINARKYF